FSSRRRHTRFSRDWSSDVCSSDLINFPKNCRILLPEKGNRKLNLLFCSFFEFELCPVQYVQKKNCRFDIAIYFLLLCLFVPLSIKLLLCFKNEIATGQCDREASAEYFDKPPPRQLRIDCRPISLVLALSLFSIAFI